VEHGRGRSERDSFRRVFPCRWYRRRPLSSRAGKLSSARIVIGKLKAQPDVAAQKLGQALEEVAKTLQAVDGAASSYLSLGIDEGALDKTSQLLLHIESGKLKTDVENGLGHCHRIWQIYQTYLNKWFSKALAADEQASMEAVFLELGNADDDLFADLGRVAEILQHEAEAVLDLVVKGDKEKARARVLASLPDLRPLRKTIAGTMQTLYGLKNDFADITGVVS
jgi:hypothetical protein